MTELTEIYGFINMKICLIGKITPIQGGVSRQNFWLAYALAKEGHDVHLVTNANEVEEEYRLIGGRVDGEEDSSPFQEVRDNLTIHFTDDRKSYAYIPFANPFVSKITSIAVEVIREYECEIILGYYFEPYGISAYFASKITGVPFGLRHAGSDVGRLMRHPDLNYLYKDMIKSADFIYCSNSTGRRFLELGVPHDKLSIMRMASYPEHIYTPDRDPLDILTHLKQAAPEIKMPICKTLMEQLHHSNFNAKLPTVGIYGKLGETKGSYDLIAALGKLKKSGVRFNFLALTSSRTESLKELYRKIVEADIQDYTVWLPFVPHWDVPRFIKLCDAVCFLERDFSIPIHRPGVAMEIMLCGGCLILSHEIAQKQRFEQELIDKKTVLLVDPKNIDELASQLQYVFDNVERAQKIGLAGREVLASKLPKFETITASINTHIEETMASIKLQERDMSMIEFQSFINRLYTNDIFRKLNEVAPEEAEQFYQLSDEEKQLLRKLDNEAVEGFSRTLITKAFGKIQGIYPLLNKAVPMENLFKNFTKFYSINPAYPGEDKQTLSNKFGEFIIQSLGDTDAGKDSYLSELARFEQIRNNVTLSSSDEDNFAYLNQKEDLSAKIELTSSISVRPSVKLCRFDYDLDHIVNQLSQDIDVALDIEKRATDIIIYSLPDEFTTKVIKTNSAAIKLIKLIVADSTAASIIDAFETQTGMQGTTDKVLDLLQFLLKSRIIAMAK